MKIIIKKNKTKPCIDENRIFVKFLKFANVKFLKFAKKLIRLYRLVTWIFDLVVWIFDKFPFYYYAKVELP